MLTDPKINVSYEQEKQIAQIICSEIKESLQNAENLKRYTRAIRSQNQYKQITKWEAANKTCNVPWKNASDYFVPLTEWIIDAVHARAMTTLFSQEPYMTAKGVETSDVPKEEGVTDFVDMIFREVVKIYDNINFYIKQLLILPFTVAKYAWEQDYDRMISKEDAQVFVHPETQEKQYLLPDNPDSQMKAIELAANGFQPAGTEPVWVAQDEELINAPQLKYIRFEDYVYSPSAKRGTRLYWEGDRCWFTVNELLLKVKQEKFIPEAVDKVNKAQSYTSQSGLDQIIGQRGALIESFHWYGRLPFNKQNEVDFADPEAIEQEVYCLVAYKEEELLQIMHWPYRRLPWPDRVYIREEFEETEDFQGRSLVEKLYSTQKELNDLMNTIMNNAWLAMQKIFVKKKRLQGEEWERPTVYPGAMWEEEMQGDIRVLEVGDVKAIGMELEQILISFAERISNISLYQTGVSREAGQKTKGEVEATIHEGNIGLDKFIQRCHNVLRKICQWTIDYYYDRMPPGLERRIRGENNEMIFPTPENMAIYAQKGIEPNWQSDNIAGKFDFIWNGTSLNSDKQWKLSVANDLMMRYLPVPMIAGNMLAVWDILKRGLEARGIKDWQKILPPKEAIVAEMQRMRQEAAVRSPAMPQGNNGGRKILG